MTNNAIIQTIPAAGSLHKVPGFDPVKYLKRAVNAKGEPVLRLELSYKKLWFRLACPNGRMLLNPLRITDQMSIIEAQVFFDRGDAAPASSFTATKAAKESPRYIRDAQDEALNEALDNAGFGIQLCDVAEVSGSRYGSEIPVSQAATQTTPSQRTNTAPVETARPAAVPQQVRKAPESPQSVSHAQPKTEVAVTAAQQPLPEQKKPESQPTAQTDNLKEVADFLAQMARQGDQSRETPAPVQTAPEQEAPDAPAAPKYTADMPVEEICKKMTLDEARAVVVPTGTCKGLTLAQVAERRRSSLKFYMFSQGTVDNVVKAAATLIWNEMELQKAG